MADPFTQKDAYDQVNFALLLLAIPCFVSIGFGPAAGIFAAIAWGIFALLTLYLLKQLFALARLYITSAQDRPGMIRYHYGSLLATLAAVFMILRANLFFAPFPIVRSAVGSLTFGLVHNPAQGTFTAEGPSIGNWTQHVDSCYSGQNKLYFGAVLRDTAQPKLAIKIVGGNPNDAQLSIDAPQQSYAVVFTRADCTRLDLDLYQGGSTYNGVRNIKGSIAFDCSSDNSHVYGQATLSNCH